MEAMDTNEQVNYKIIYLVYNNFFTSPYTLTHFTIRRC
jgi:hypothetical protein